MSGSLVRFGAPEFKARSTARTLKVCEANRVRNDTGDLAHIHFAGHAKTSVRYHLTKLEQ